MGGSGYCREIQECYKNRRKSDPPEMLVRGNKGRKRKETQQEAAISTPPDLKLKITGSEGDTQVLDFYLVCGLLNALLAL